MAGRSRRRKKSGACRKNTHNSVSVFDAEKVGSWQVNMPLDLIRPRRSGLPAKAKLGGQVAARCFALQPGPVSRRWPALIQRRCEESFACGCLKTREGNPHRTSYPFQTSGIVGVPDPGGKLSSAQKAGDRGSAVAARGLIEFSRLRIRMIVDATRSRVAGLG
jgi:hypothetical protein